MVYVFDTSSLRVLGNYFPGRFPTFWERFEAEIANEEARSVREVYNELCRQSTKEWLLAWARKRRSRSGDEIAELQTFQDTDHMTEELILRHERASGSPRGEAGPGSNPDDPSAACW